MPHPTRNASWLPCFSLIKGQGKRSVGNANFASTFSFSPGPVSEPFPQELPNCSPVCSLFSLITDFTWFLVKVFGVFGSCTHRKWQSPFLLLTVAEEAKMITCRSSKASVIKTHLGFSPSYSLLLRQPPTQRS